MSRKSVPVFNHQPRYNRISPCPVCGGYADSTEKPCLGHISANRQWASCTSKEHAGTLPLNPNLNTYAHHSHGSCPCGIPHASTKGSGLLMPNKTPNPQTSDPVPNTKLPSPETDPPIPLTRPMQKADPFPTNALGPILGPAVNDIQSAVQAPSALCANSVLAVASMAVQTMADIDLDGRRIPLSEYFLTVANWNERKNLADRWALQPLRDGLSHEDNKHIRNFFLLLQQSVDNGLYNTFREKTPSAGLFSEDSDTLLQGYARNRKTQLKSAAQLAKLWEGEQHDFRSDGSAPKPGRRLSLHLAIQPQSAGPLLNNDNLSDPSLLARVLTVYPESLCGQRFYRPVNLNECTGYQAYRYQIERILKKIATEFENPKMRQVDPAGMPKAMRKFLREYNPIFESKSLESRESRTLTLSPQAKEKWVDFYNQVEAGLAPQGEFSHIQLLANQAAEHALRLAGILTLFHDPQAQTIEEDFMQNGIVLMNHYLNEASRLTDSGMYSNGAGSRGSGGNGSNDLELAQHVLNWLQKDPQRKVITLVELYTGGPRKVRDSIKARRAIKCLEQHRWLIPHPQGAEYENHHRQEAWQLTHQPNQPESCTNSIPESHPTGSAGVPPASMSYDQPDQPVFRRSRAPSTELPAPSMRFVVQAHQPQPHQPLLGRAGVPPANVSSDQPDQPESRVRIHAW